MKTIAEIVCEFLDEQQERLKQRTFNDYDSVMDLFQIYLNNYAYQHLPTEVRKEFLDQHWNDEDYFVKTFGLDQLTSSLYSEFFEYFIIRKVAGSQSFMKNAVRVLKKFTEWLHETNHIPEDHYEQLMGYFSGDKSTQLPNAEKVSDLIYELAKKSPKTGYDDVREDFFTIVKIEPEKLWVDQLFETETNIGPITITKEISDLLVIDWDLSLVIGKKNNEWTIIESGYVYPT